MAPSDRGGHYVFNTLLWLEASDSQVITEFCSAEASTTAKCFSRGVLYRVWHAASARNYRIHISPCPHFPARGDSPLDVNSLAIDNIGLPAEPVVTGNCQMMTPSEYVHPSVNDSLSILGAGLPSLCQEVE